MAGYGVLLDKDALASHVSVEEFAQATRYVDVAFLRDDKNHSLLEDKMLRVFVLSCSHGTGSEDRKRVVSGGQFGQNKKAKFSKEMSYNRFFLVADLESPPNCAAIMTRTIDESSRLLSILTGGPFVGEPFMVYEPGPAMTTLGEYTPILKVENSPLLPLKDPSGQLKSTEGSMVLPSNVGQTNYFVLTGKKIALSKVKLAPFQTCLGIQCDRQKSNVKGGCTCLHATSSSSLVYQCNVTFEVPKKVDASGQVTVLDFCSLKTTRLFFRNFDTFVNRYSMNDLRMSNQSVRKHWSDAMQYINENDGWTLIGWFMLGDHADAANSHDKVQNFQTTVHLTSLQPTNIGVLKTEEFLKACIDDKTFTTVQTAAQIVINSDGTRNGNGDGALSTLTAMNSNGNDETASV
jgi:hypothetical protein